MRRGFYGTLLLAGAIFAAGCDNVVENATTPTGPAPTTTDTFEGSINVNGAMTHTFTTAAAGQVVVTVTEITPDAEVPVGLALGTWNGSACATSLAMDAAVQGNQLTGSVSGPGNLCVRVHDNGRLTEAITYKLSVTHP